MVLRDQVAVANNGNIFVADGYCNARVVEYTPEGVYLGEFQLPADAGGPMRVPHSVVCPAVPQCPAPSGCLTCKRHAI